MNLFLAEWIGSFVLVFMGTGAVVVNDLTGGVVSHSGVALVFGMAVMAMVYSVGEISGAHLNPAVTLGFFLAGRFPARPIPLYFMAQTTGALAASLVLHAIFPSQTHLGVTIPSSNISIPGAWALECLLSFVLMFVILNVATGSREQGIMAGMAVGMTVAMEALFAGPVTGASMNPARSLAPALVSGYRDSLWIYVSAPFAGAALASFLHRLMERERKKAA